jgi:hypothetical protein
MNRDPDNAVTIISADGVSHGHLEGNTLHVMTRPEDLVSCQCEHVCHFDNRAVHDHKYGALFNAIRVEQVQTVCGTFALCPTCRETCFPPDSPYRKTHDR